MISNVRARVLPASQRRTLDELTEDLILSAGDTAAKRSAFWTMLTLSAVIAAGGVLTDSTATVIGAMIIAPLSTPIMGIALGSVQRRRTGSITVVLLACLLVIATGMLMSLVLPADYDLLSNSQISSRTAPTLMDLVAALATGLAGAVALARRDVAAVLPGVAIAISLVPPLVVTGVCLGQLAGWQALGALALFVSNLFALVCAGMLVFAALGYAGEAEADRAAGRPGRRAYAAMALLFAVSVVPLAADTTATVLLNVWTGRARNAAQQWLADEPNATVTGVDAQSRTLHIHVRVPGELPPVRALLDRLDGQLPDGIPVVVDVQRGRRVDAGKVGD
ncbi:membrane protein [Streptomyces sp. NBRC 14336]|uniref:TIGR00341 family protein n=1 Tax=Streptomyces sp. NBRC 14336 TaxID=3030992 RepID=UPI0024A43BC4|nr:TIGR00341 family protein [Streptomyces sp. NBRC 14336]WBO79475.1 TIGR00341 family protein [Streptomyces sp. SBE_14.2]GLW49031.1 membrane protein [Streptomyces sp. NBRC 14336]